MTVFNFFLLLHIIGGTIGLLAGTYITYAKKGDKIHKLIGKIFATNMLCAGICSFVLATLHRNDFLFAVGIFTIYLVGTGWRYLYLKNISDGQKPKLIDWFLMLFMFIASVLFLIMAVKSFIDKEYFGLIVLIFAWRGFSSVIADYKIYNGKIKAENYWLLFHLQRMMGAYIASLTAFIVVNAPDRISFLPWILPALIFVPLIFKWTRKYKITTS